MSRLSAPEPLGDQHQLEHFRCGDDQLDRWLRHRALANQRSGATRTVVVCRQHPEADRPQEVVGFVALASGGVEAQLTPGRFRRNMPDPIPVVILARLAVDRSVQGRGLARALVADACRRVLLASEQIGVRGLLVQAASVEARNLYLHLGFDPSPLDPMVLMLRLVDLKAALD